MNPDTVLAFIAGIIVGIAVENYWSMKIIKQIQNDLFKDITKK